jgi:hypothetical protein
MDENERNKKLNNLLDEDTNDDNSSKNVIISKRNDELNIINENFRYWRYCILISFIPIIASLIVCVARGKPGIINYLIEALSNSSVIYIGISLMITLVYDFITNNKLFKYKIPIQHFAILAINIIIYVVLLTTEIDSSKNIINSVLLNITFLFIVLIFGVNQFRRMQDKLREIQ